MRHGVSSALAAAACVVMGSVSAVLADEYVETFEDGLNPAGWTYAPWDTIEPSGGNPGRYLSIQGLDTFAPQPRTGWGIASPFTGNYQVRGVTHLGVDLILHHVDFSAGDRPLSVLLVSDNGTPNDFDDDWAAYFVGTENIPLVGEGWKSFLFEVPSQETSTPAGWDYLEFGPNSPTNPQWEDIITNVSQVVFFYGDPTFFFIFQMWDAGLDNARIVFETGGATLVDVSAPFGEILSGGVQELLASDDTYVHGRSQFGFSATEPNILDLVVGAETSVASPSTFNLTIEMRLNNPGGTARARLKNWKTNAFEQVGEFSTQTSDTVHEINNVSATGRVRASDGRIELSVRSFVVATFSASGFDAWFDQTLIEVNSR